MTITSTPAANFPATTSAATPSSRTDISADFETFLKMLTVQMQNQDPLNPVDSTDYAVQLATFSGVEQQVQTNDLLKGLGATFGATGLAQLAGWVGLEARTAAPVPFDGTPLSLSVSPAATADAAELWVIDDRGQPVQQIAIPPDQAELSWAGVGENGQPMRRGTYTFEVVSLALGQEIGRIPAETYGRVTEVQSDAQGQRVVLDDGRTIAVTQVSAVRDSASG